MIETEIKFFDGEPIEIKATNLENGAGFDEYCSTRGALFYPGASANSLQLRHKFLIWLNSQVWSDKILLGDVRSLAHLLELLWLDIPKRKSQIDTFVVKSKDNGTIASICQPISNNRVETESPPSDEEQNPGDLWESSEGGD